MKSKKKKIISILVVFVLVVLAAIPFSSVSNNVWAAQAAEYGIDTTGMSSKEIKEVVKVVKKDWATVKKVTEDFGIDIEGLDLEAAKEKVEVAQILIGEESADANKDELEAILNAIAALNAGKEKKFMKAVSTLDSCIPGISAMPYEEAKDILIAAIKGNMGLDITTMSTKEAQAAVEEGIMAGLAEEADYYGVDVEGLSFAKAQSVLDAAKQIRMAAEFEEMYAKAKQYGLDITGLTKEAAWEQIKKAEMEGQNDNKENDKQVELTKRAAEYGIDITGLTSDQAWHSLMRESLQTCSLKQKSTELT